MSNFFEYIQNAFTSTKKRPKLTTINREQFANAAIVGNSKFINSYGDIGLSAIFSAINLISNTIASMPIDVFKINGKHERKWVSNEITRLLNIAPSIYYVPFVFIKTLVVHYYVYGNAYVKINREGGKVSELLILNPSMVLKNVDVTTGEIRYTISGIDGYFTSDDIIHIVNYSNNGLEGLSILNIAKNTIEAYKCQETHSLSYHKGGSNFAGIITPNNAISNGFSEVKLTTDQGNQIIDALKAATDTETGTPNGIVVMPADVKYQKISADPNAFIIDSRKFSIEEVARFFNINPILIGDLTHANYANSEQARLSLLGDTLMPIIKQMEQEFRRKLFIGSLSEKYIIKFDLLRFSNVDVDTLHRICREDVKSGLMTINEARDIIDFDESSEEIANKLLIQSNNTSTAEGLIAKEKYDTNQPIVNKNNNINNE